MTITASEYEYGNPLATRKSWKTKKTHKVSPAAVVVGLLVLTAAIVEAYGCWRLRGYIIRLNSFRAFDALMAPPNIQQQILRGIAVSEATLLVWLGFAWLGNLLLGLSGLWSAVRRRFGWRMLWAGAIATILAGGLTVLGGYVLEHYAGFPPQAKRIYGIAFLIHSAPGWVILLMWLTRRFFTRKPEPQPAPQSEDRPAPPAEGSPPPTEGSPAQEGLQGTAGGGDGSSQ